MPEQHLDRPNIRPVLQEMGRETVAQYPERDLRSKAQLRLVDAADSTLESAGCNTPLLFVKPEIAATERPALEIVVQGRRGLVGVRESSAVVVLASADSDGLRAEIKVVESESVGFTRA